MKKFLGLIVLGLLACSKSGQSEEANEKKNEIKSEVKPDSKTEASPEKPADYDAQKKNSEEENASKKAEEVVIKAEPWNGSSTYEKGDTVKQADKFWIANRKVYQNTPPPDSWFWRPVNTVSGSESESGSDSYNSGVTYDSGATVIFNEKKYQARRKVFLNTTPADQWFWEEVKEDSNKPK